MNIPKGIPSDKIFQDWLKSLPVGFIDYLYLCYKINESLNESDKTNKKNITKPIIDPIPKRILPTRLHNTASKPITQSMLDNLPPEY